MQRSATTLLAAAICLAAGICQAQTSTPASNLRIVVTDDAPKAAGPYSQGVVAGDFLFVAGMTPRDPKTGNQVTNTFGAAANATCYRSPGCAAGWPRSATDKRTHFRVRAMTSISRTAPPGNAETITVDLAGLPAPKCFA